MNIDDLRALLDEIEADAPADFTVIDGEGRPINAVYISWTAGAIVIMHDPQE